MVDFKNLAWATTFATRAIKKIHLLALQGKWGEKLLSYPVTSPILYSSLLIQSAKHKNVKHVYVNVTLNLSHLITADDDATHTVQLALDTVCKTQTRQACLRHRDSERVTLDNCR